MRTAGDKAFTMVELLMVIAIIALLAMLVVPAVLRAVDLAIQAKCNTSVKTIIQGLRQYSSVTVSGEMPYMPRKSTGGWNWNTAIGTNRNSADPLIARNHSANLWLLVREEHVGVASFVCPATTDSPREDVNEKVKDYWDFASGSRISYGLQSPYGHGGSLTALTPPDVVLVADGNPYVTASGVIHTDWAGAAEDTMTLSSRNHEFEGQNTGYWDGRVKWETGPTCGKDGDNIYTASNHVTGTSATGSLTAAAKNNENDTLILP